MMVSDDPFLLAKNLGDLKTSKTAIEVKSKSNQKTSDILTFNKTTLACVKSKKSCWYPENLLEIINAILNFDINEMKKPNFKFEWSRKAANHNWDTLAKYSNLGMALEANSKTQLGYGSEFRPALILEPLMKNHPLWQKLKDQLLHGVTYPMEDLSTEDRFRDLREAFEFGNHKGVAKNKEFFIDTMKTEVKNGWQLILPRHRALEIKDALLAPMNVIQQKSINEKGEIIEKMRLTHDQGMKFSSKTSVNSRVHEEEIQDPMYGHCLLRLIHLIVSFRKRNPTKRILIGKVDYKGAYRRGHLNWKIAIQTMTQCVDSNLAFIALRMTFGGSPNPSLWGNISESVIDLTNALLRCKEWDPTQLKSPIQHLVPPKEENDEKRNKPLAQSLPLAIDTEVNDDWPRADIYIDDGISVAVDINDNVLRAATAALLAMHIFGRPIDDRDPIQRKHLASLSKLAAEGRMQEIQILLGWKVDTRKLEVSLPFDKFKAWKDSINNMISCKRSSFKELESTIGRLGHVTTIIPYMKHFMSRIRLAMERATNRRSIQLNHDIIEDLQLHLKFLLKANEGISMNLLTVRKITRAYRTDACPAGIGGFSNKGRAWRWKIPTHLQYRMTLNMLEFVASIISPWIDIIEDDLPELSCILSMTDSSTTEGWLRKSNFKENENESIEMTRAKRKLSRDHASRMMNKNCKDFSQWFEGDANELADSLSRDFHLSNEYLTSIYHHSIPKQTPPNLKISPPPEEIISYLYAMLQSLPETTQRPEKHKISKVSLGAVGQDFSNESTSTETRSSTTSPKGTEPSSSVHLPKQSETESFLNRMIDPWSTKLSEMPWTMYARPSESITDQTQNLTQTKSLHEFYKSSSKAIKAKTLLRNTKKQSP